MSRRRRSRTNDNHNSKKTVKSGNRARFLRNVASTAADYGISGYLIVLIAILPFYFTQGYGYIATDKATFFGKVSVNFLKVLIPILIVYLIAAIAVYYANVKSKKGEEKFLTRWNLNKCRISVTDAMVGLYGLAAVISYFCSNYKEDALWGAKGWYMGLVPQLILVGIYFAVSKLWRPQKGIFYLLLPVSAVVFGLGYLNRFGVYPFEMEWRNPSYISTIGNINWYCGYSVIVFFAMVGMFWQSSVQQQKVKKWCGELLWGFYLCLGFGSLVVQGSFSGIVTIAAMLVILFCLSTGDRKRILRFWRVVLAFSISCLVTMVMRRWFPEAITLTDEATDLLTGGELPIFMTVVSSAGLVFTYWICRIYKEKQKDAYSPEKIFRGVAIALVTLVSCAALVVVGAIIKNTLTPGSIGAWSEIEAFTFSPSWGSNRGATWRAGVMCFSEQNFLHKLVGVGPDAMSAYIYNDGSQQLLAIMQERFGSLALTNAHNEWLTVLVDLGLLGLVAYVGMIVSAVYTFARCIGGKRESTQTNVSAQKSSEKDYQWTELPVACAIGILAYTINNMFSFQQTMNGTMFFILLGMGRAFMTFFSIKKYACAQVDFK